MMMASFQQQQQQQQPWANSDDGHTTGSRNRYKRISMSNAPSGTLLVPLPPLVSYHYVTRQWTDQFRRPLLSVSFSFFSHFHADWANFPSPSESSRVFISREKMALRAKLNKGVHLCVLFLSPRSVEQNSSREAKKKKYRLHLISSFLSMVVIIGWGSMLLLLLLLPAIGRRSTRHLFIVYIQNGKGKQGKGWRQPDKVFLFVLFWMAKRSARPFRYIILFLPIWTRRGGGRVKRITESTQVKEPLQFESHLHKLREKKKKKKKKKLAHESISIKDQKEQKEKKKALFFFFFFSQARRPMASATFFFQVCRRRRLHRESSGYANTRRSTHNYTRLKL